MQITEQTNIPSAPCENRELKLAWEFVRHTASHIFLTGKAGTGKTTFLHQLKGNLAKRMIITAPTGVAAINAGGVTLHSFFQLPFGPFIPGSEAYETISRRMFRFSKEKKRIIKTLDLLVIDEISMVRADLLDSVDAVLRHHRRNNKPFGGVQLLLIGDLHQLSPVAKKEEWQLLQEHYESVYFFSSHALEQAELLTIELKHIYRQSDPRFIKLLNQVRDNRLDTPAFEQLNSRYHQNFTPEEDKGYITLTTHNNRADAINASRLNALPGKNYYFEAKVSGDFPEYTFPTQGCLKLKEGAQVMFLRNDSFPEKRYYNGKTGKITHISQHKIGIVCPNESKEIIVEPVQWENIKYSFDKEKMAIQEDIIGTFKQFPLKAAWAITIHKSQGLTFDRAIIDAESAFSHGQVYVALSRCKTFEGMVLSSPIPPGAIETDDAVLKFVETARQNPPSENRLRTAKISFQQQLLMDCFDFQSLHHRLNYLARLITDNARVIQLSGISDIGRLQDRLREQILTVSEKFKNQLQSNFTDERLPASDGYILERTAKASTWFQEQFSLVFNDLVQKFNTETDNRELRKKIINALNHVKQEFTVKRAGIKSCEKGFSPSRYLSAVSQAEIDLIPERSPKSQTPVYGESDIEHPELFQELKAWRSRKAEEKGVPHFQIMHQRVLIHIAVALPGNESELKKIKGVGGKTIENYGIELLKLVGDYRRKYGIEVVILPKPREISKDRMSPGKNISASDTKKISFDMFNTGLSMADIAKERGLVESTIQGHLCFFVEKGELDINRILSTEKQNAIKAAILKTMDNSFKSVKEELGEYFSYGEIKLMAAHQRYLDSSK